MILLIAAAQRGCYMSPDFALLVVSGLWLYASLPWRQCANTMLAYVFWHKPFPDVPLEEYEAALAEFHKRLGAASCPGFRGSIAYRISETPWLGQDRAYEDWNFVDGSWALDPLIAGQCQAQWRAFTAELPV